MNWRIRRIDMLTELQQKLWEFYEQQEGIAPRAEKLLALETFLDSLAASPETDWFPWARSLAEKVVDKGQQFVIRAPLFERAVYPALLAGHRAGLRGCARWLAGLSQHLYRCARCCKQLPPEERTEAELLRAATRHDPADRVSRQRIIEKMANNYSIRCMKFLQECFTALMAPRRSNARSLKWSWRSSVAL